MAQTLRKSLQDTLRQVSELSLNDLVDKRIERLMSYGRFKEQPLH
jgi:acetyl-CoA carboxylase carboxyl transferase subunit alpha